MLSFLSFFTIKTLIAGATGLLVAAIVVGSIRSSKKNKISPKRTERLTANEGDRDRALSQEKSAERESLKAVEIKKEAQENKIQPSSGLNPLDKSHIRDIVAKIKKYLDQGLDSSQILRSLIGMGGEKVPSYELVPLIDALARFMSGYDEKTAKAMDRFNPRGKEMSFASDSLSKGDVGPAMAVLSRKLESMSSSFKETMGNYGRMDPRVQASEYARHLAVLSRYGEARSSYMYAKRAVDINPGDVKNQDILGYMELSLNNLNEAQRCFEEALRNEAAEPNKAWRDLAMEGLEAVKEKREDEPQSRDAIKTRPTMDYAVASRKDYVRDE